MNGDAKNRELLRQHVCDELRSTQFRRRVEAIHLLPELDGREAIRIIKTILKLEDNLGLKLEVLSIIDKIVDSQTSDDGCQLLISAVSLCGVM